MVTFLVLYFSDRYGQKKLKIKIYAVKKRG